MPRWLDPQRISRVLAVVASLLTATVLFALTPGDISIDSNALDPAALWPLSGTDEKPSSTADTNAGRAVSFPGAPSPERTAPSAQIRLADFAPTAHFAVLTRFYGSGRSVSQRSSFVRASKARVQSRVRAARLPFARAFSTEADAGRR